MKNNMKNIPALLLLLFGGLLKANNIQVASVTLNGKDLSAGANNAANSTFVQFDLSWENSWRANNGATNWDAAWVFIKYRVSGGSWQHAWLGNNGHTIPSGFTADAGLLTPGSAYNAVTNPALGVFIYRSNSGNGNNSLSSVKLRWNHGAQGIPDNAIVDVRVFAIEMVYVPQGSFQAGDGLTASVQGNFREAGLTTPFTISSESALTLGGTSAGNLAANTDMLTADDFDNTTTQTLPSVFPKGYNAFYCMKYEITQGQYRDYLNTLTYNQQKGATLVPPDTLAGTGALIRGNRNRNGLDIMTPGVDSSSPAVYGCNLDGDNTYNENNDGEWIVCGYLYWWNGAAYTDWAGLRPMTELEYEKACRGPLAAVPNELAWGTINTTTATLASITNPGEANEYVSIVGANAAIRLSTNDSLPIVRAGAFATAGDTRISSGATYWGIMEMSGNLWERTVDVGNTQGRLFDGKHGNGLLTANGYANVNTWTGAVSGVVTGSQGSGYRGGAAISVASGGTSTAATISRRRLANTTTDRNNAEDGFRAVRTAP